MEENVDALCATAGELGLLKVPCFMFQEGNDRLRKRPFREIARLTGGAWCRFDMGSAATVTRIAARGCGLRCRRAGGAEAAGDDTSGAAALLGQMKQA